MYIKTLRTLAEVLMKYQLEKRSSKHENHMNLCGAADEHGTWGELLEMKEVPKTDEGEVLGVNQHLDSG